MSAKVRVLLVDDETRKLAILLNSLLRFFGHPIPLVEETADLDVAAAAKIIERYLELTFVDKIDDLQNRILGRPHILLLDIRFTEIGEDDNAGLELAPKLRHRLPDTYICFYTQHTRLLYGRMSPVSNSYNIGYVCSEVGDEFDRDFSEALIRSAGQEIKRMALPERLALHALLSTCGADDELLEAEANVNGVAWKIKDLFIGGLYPRNSAHLRLRDEINRTLTPDLVLVASECFNTRAMKQITHHTEVSYTDCKTGTELKNQLIKQFNEFEATIANAKIMAGADDLGLSEYEKKVGDFKEKCLSSGVFDESMWYDENIERIRNLHFRYGKKHDYGGEPRRQEIKFKSNRSNELESLTRIRSDYEFEINIPIHEIFQIGFERFRADETPFVLRAEKRDATQGESIDCVANYIVFYKKDEFNYDQVCGSNPPEYIKAFNKRRFDIFGQYFVATRGDSDEKWIVYNCCSLPSGFLIGSPTIAFPDSLGGYINDSRATGSFHIFCFLTWRQ
ncbi:MAG: response regulator [Planctomycetes bacterium]|nr:response regulator [Planctomycetota bacterium]